jgi:hypothetical protein
MMACTGENLAKMTDHLATMPQTPKRTAMMREIGMVNTDMSNGNMRGACTHYMIASPREFKTTCVIPSETCILSDELFPTIES